MTASDKSTRRANDAERLRHIAATEAAAFATTAGTMLLGLLTGAAEAAQQRPAHDKQAPDASDHTQPPPDHPVETTPTTITPPVEHASAHDHYTATIGTQSPTVNAIAETHADTAPSIHGLDTSVIDSSPGSTPTSPAYHLVTPMPAWSFEPHSEHVQTSASGTDLIGSLTSLPVDPAPPINQIATTITGVLDTSLGAVSHTLSVLGSTVGQITSTLSNTVSTLTNTVDHIADGLTNTVDHLTDGLTSTVTGVVHDLSSGIVQPLLTDVLGSTSTASATAPAQHDGLSLDTAGVVPISLLHPMPLHLGFLGQPTIDGHDWHDGAFSALGIHHF
jgi:hypothetical protein